MLGPRRGMVVVALWGVVAACGKTGTNAGDSDESSEGSGGTTPSNTASTGSFQPPFDYGPEDCPPASSSGCCFGDGACCSCVAKACDSWAMGGDPGIREFTACV